MENTRHHYSLLSLLFGSINDDENNVRLNASWENVIEKSSYSVIYYIGILLVCYVITEFVMKWVTNWKGLKLKKLAGQISMYPAFLFLVYTSHVGTFADSTFWSSFEVRHSTSNQIIDDFANFYIAANIVQAIGQVQTETSPLLYQLMAHHVLSISCYTSGFYFDRFRWWEAFAGCCEVTNIFLVPVFMCKEFFPEWQEKTWYLWNCRILWLTFVTHRLILFPCKSSPQDFFLVFLICLFFAFHLLIFLFSFKKN